MTEVEVAGQSRNVRLEWNNKAQREEKGLSLRLRARPVRPPSRRLARAIRFLLAFPGTPCCMSDCHCAISGPGVYVKRASRGAVLLLAPARYEPSSVLLASSELPRSIPLHLLCSPRLAGHA